MLEKLRAQIQSTAEKCPSCGKRMRLSLVDLGNGDMVDSTFSCRNAECSASRHKVRSSRRMNAGLTEEALLLVPVDEMATYKRYRAAALRVRIKCPICGAAERYVRSGVGSTGKLIHLYMCDNAFCPNRDQIKIELTEEDVRKIEEQKEPTDCPVCGKTLCSSVRCPKEGGLICESHCFSCKHHEDRTGHCHFLNKEQEEAKAKAAVDGLRWFNGKVLNF